MSTYKYPVYLFRCFKLDLPQTASCLSAMSVWFNPSHAIEQTLRQVAATTEGFSADFEPGVRPADPKFGDYQANGVLGYAKKNDLNPRELGQKLIDAALASGQFDPELIELALAGPGFINFKLSNTFLWQWQLDYSTKADYQSGAKELKQGRRNI